MKSWEENSANSPKVPQVSIVHSNGWGVDRGFGEKQSLARHLPALSCGWQDSNEPSERSAGMSSLRWRMPQGQRARLAAWICSELPWPAEITTLHVDAPRRAPEVNAETRGHWSFRPVQKPDLTASNET